MFGSGAHHPINQNPLPSRGLELQDLILADAGLVTGLVIITMETS